MKSESWINMTSTNAPVGLYCHPNKRMNMSKAEEIPKKYQRDKNYINLTYKSRNSSLISKLQHANVFIKRRDEFIKSGREIPNFLELTYLIRSHCIVLSYFPKGSDYHEKFGNYDNHPGWEDSMSSNERDILFSYKKSADTLKKNPYDTYLFDEVDIKFGKYRRLRWLGKMSLV